MKSGDSFDPVDVTRRLKLYPVDVVDARRDISDGPKRLYAQIFRIAVTTDRRKHPWPGYIFASEQFLSERLGKSQSGIRRDAAELRKLRLIQVERPSRTETNRYSFLWTPEFDRSDVSGHQLETEAHDSANVGGRDRAEVSAHICTDSANVGGPDSANVSARNKEEQIVLANTGRPAERMNPQSLQIPKSASEGKQKNAPPGFALDEQFAEFRTAWRQWQPSAVDPEDFHDAFRWEWSPLDFFQRRDVIASVRARIIAGIDPLGWKPKNFLKSEWKRPIKAPARPPAQEDYSYGLPGELAQ